MSTPLPVLLSRTLPSLSISPPPPYEDALSLELSVLHLVLKRNRRQHFRAQYFRRMDMIRRALIRCGCGTSGEDGVGTATRAARVMADALGAEVSRKRARGRGEERWITGRRSSSAGTGGKDPASDDDDESEPPPLGPVSAVARRLRSAVTAHLPSILSRILHAAEALCAELARGYFVPLCSTLLACAGRLRALLMREGRDGCDALSRLSSSLEEALGGTGSSTILPKAYDEEDAVEARRLCAGLSFDAIVVQFVGETAADYNAALNRRRRDEVLRRGGSSVGSSGKGGGGGSSSRASVTSDDGGSEIDGNPAAPKHDRDGDLGEIIDTGEEEVVAVDKEMADADDGGAEGRKIDVNDEMVELMRRKRAAAAEKEEGRKKRKKKRKKSSRDERIGSVREQAREQKEDPPIATASNADSAADAEEEENGRWEASSSSALDDLMGSTEWGSESDKKSDTKADKKNRGGEEDETKKKKQNKKEKKKKDKKKKSKSKRDVVDDIFDGF